MAEGYDAHSRYQLEAAGSYAGVVRHAAGDAVQDVRDPFVGIADYGCAQGQSSDPLLREAIAEIRTTRPRSPIFVCHNDQPSNDWAALLARLEGPDSYLAVSDGPVTPLISPVSFYTPVLPRGTVHLGVSFAAAQWLSVPGPTDAGTAVYFDQLEGEHREAMRRQAQADWGTFLRLRADELAPGGRLVMDLMVVADDGTPAGHDLWRELRRICLDMADEGQIDSARLSRYVLPVYERTREEVLEPFEAGSAGGLAIEALATRPIPNPYAERYRRDGDAEAYGADFAGFVRAFAGPSLRRGLDLSPDAEDEIFRRLARAVAERADGFWFEVTTILLVVARA